MPVLSIDELVIPRPAGDAYAPYFQRYIDAVADARIGAQLAAQREHLTRLLAPLDEVRAAHRYAPGKWSVREVVGHVSDTERIFAYRLLRIARGDATPLPGFDENDYVAHGAFDDRPMAELVDEFRAVRTATMALVTGLPAAAWGRRGTASERAVSTAALAWMLVGHVAHHVRLLHERYGIAPPIMVDARD
jgi:uncharacterized protein (TIGR03083 family)